MVHALAQSHHGERGFHMLLSLLAGETGEKKRQLDIFKRGEHRDQIVELEYKADMSRAPISKLGFG